VWSLLTETGYYSYMGILPGGPERQANLRLLFERARQYEETSYRGLFNFIQFIKKLRSGGGDIGSAKVIGESDNVVRIMSIHKSKGLEFPIVIVAGCGKRFNLLDLNASILLHQDLGFGPDLVDLEKRTISPSMPKCAIRQKLRLETLSEEMRILYVAFTRAKEKLILTGCIHDTAKTCAKWCSIADAGEEALSPYDMQQASSYLDWVGPAISRHPSARPIRQAASCGEIRLVREEGSCWDVKLWGLGAAAADREEEAEKTIRDWLESIPAQDGSAGRLSQMLEWQYPYKDLSGVPAKISVTELKRRFADQEREALSGEAAAPFVQPLVARPLFMETEKGLSAARKGTVMHFFMQHVDLSKLSAIVKDEKNKNYTAELSQELESQLVSMAAREQLTSAEADAVHIPAICSFFESPVGMRMLFSPFVCRETPFNIEIHCTEIYKELPPELFGNEKMLLQGVIDCWFESEEGLVLLDYKTDYVPAGESEMIRERYKVQLDYYTRALETISGQKVTEKYLYLFNTGELLSC
jgi:ATP-dependent helicase/nuclease subunit A